MKKVLSIDDSLLNELLEANKSEEFSWNKNKIVINNVMYYRQSIVTDTSTKSTAQSLIKKEAEFDYNFCDEMYGILDEHKLDHIMYARPAKSVVKNDSLRANIEYHYQIDLYSAYPHILKYEKLPIAGNLYTEEDADLLNFYKYTGKYLNNNCIVTNDLKEYIEKNGLGKCEYMFSTDYKIGSKIGDKLMKMVYKNKKTKEEAKQIHYGFYQKKYLEYDIENDCYNRYEEHKYEILMIAILSQLVYIMLNIRDIISDDAYHFVKDAYFFNNIDDVNDVASRLKSRFEKYDFRIIDCTVASEEDKHGTIIYKSYPDLPDAPRSHHKKKLLKINKMYIDLLVNCDNRQYIKNMIIYNQKGDKIMKYEVAEETGMRLVLNTENAGYIELAEVIGDFIYVYIDDVDYFDNVYQCEEAEQDVLKFVEFWRNKGKKLYNEED